ncbi:MAG: peptide chain release factor N(5)-glutamine methyltransferase [Acidobacteria bacterium]|nr:MAG: peptide chain release factor N(5)-glutamine methyltransferase [Acidobacteriota bacterium]
MPNLRELLTEGVAGLERAGVAEQRLTAELLLAHALERERSYLYAHPEEDAEPEALARWRAALSARAAGTPLQYITGEQEFYGRRFTVSPAVLIPRPETEMVVEAALERTPANPPVRVLDVGTGSGCIAVTLALERPRAQVMATDVSASALEVAQENARRLGASIEFKQTDLLAGVEGPFDLIVSNPPYVAEGELAALQPEVREHEPRVALVSGSQGNEIYQRLIPQAQAALVPGGWLVLEMGYASAQTVVPLLAAWGWTDIATQADTLGWQRVLTARRG